MKASLAVLVAFATGVAGCSADAASSSHDGGAGAAGSSGSGAGGADASGGTTAGGGATAGEGGASGETASRGSGGAPAGSGGASGSAGTSASGGSSNRGGSGGLGAGGGSDPGGGMPCAANSASWSSVLFNVTLAPGLTSDDICTCTGLQVTLKAPNGATLYPGSSEECGAMPCDTCLPRNCDPGPPCSFRAFLPSTDGIYRWNSDYYTRGSCGPRCTTPGCGPALACQDFACARDGHYSATFCLDRAATMSGSSCTRSAQQACATVEFDLPSTAPVAVVLGS